jgi:D-glucosaminate-6-phosphate ammonia-lyase
MNRRSFLEFVGLLSGWRPWLRSEFASVSPNLSIYTELGVRPFINAAGAYTELGGGLIREEVLDLMQEVSLRSVSITELQHAVGKQIALMLGCEAALVTAGCASSLALATAACIAGKDPGTIRRLPEASASKCEVIMQRSHRFEYDHAIRNSGAKIVEIETLDELKAAVSGRTAMLFFLNSANYKGKIFREEFAQTANLLGIPVLIDAAADLPPVENLYILTRMGYDLVGFSGGKSLRGPQCSGLLLGKKDLVEAAFLNGSPHSDSLGRVSKVGKEEIVGLYRALQVFVKTDHAAEWNEWKRRVSVILSELSLIPGVKGTMSIPEPPHNRPTVDIQWNPEEISLSPQEVITMLRSGDPRIELAPGSENSSTGLQVAVWMLRPQEDVIVARRLTEVLKSTQRPA